MREHRVGRAVAADRDRRDRRRHAHFVQRARLDGCDVAWHAFLQQQFRRLHSRLRVKAFDHAIAEEGIGQGDEGHSLVMGQVGRNDYAL